MLLSATCLQTPLPNPPPPPTTTTANTNLLFFTSLNSHKPTQSLKTPLLTTTANASPSSSSSPPLQNPETLRHVTSTLPSDDDEVSMVSSASAIASAIRNSSSSPVEFVQRIESAEEAGSKMVLPSADFQSLCSQQLDLFRRIVEPEAVLSVYVRPAGSYVMDQLELRRVTCYPGGNAAADVVILVGNFNVPTGLRAAEAALSGQQVQFIPEHSAIVFPMVKHPFVVGFLVAELSKMEVQMLSSDLPLEQHVLIRLPLPDEAHDMQCGADKKLWEFETLEEKKMRICNFTSEKIMNAIDISQSLAMAYVMDQKAILLQQSSRQNNVRMSNLVEQIRGPLSSIQTLSKMLSTRVKRNEISSDIVEGIMVQAGHISNTLQELQEAVDLTKATIVQYNEQMLKRITNSTYAHPESMTSQLSEMTTRNMHHNFQISGEPLSSNSPRGDIEIPMPPLALTPLQQRIKPCNVSEVLLDLVDAVRPLAHKQQRDVEFNGLSQSLQVAVEEPALRQALSNLIEGALLRTHIGGKVDIVSTGAPTGGVLIVIDDHGPDMHYMMCSLPPFGAELLAENMIEDNMTWNFVAGLTVAREILESYGCIVRVISPLLTDAALGTGGTRIELWLPSYAALADLKDIAHEP